MKTKSKTIFTMVFFAFAIELSWSDINLVFQDGKKSPIQGVSCTANGSAPAVSDLTGKLTLTPIAANLKPHWQSPNNRLPSQIPLDLGENATIVIRTLKGQIILNKKITLGEKLMFSQSNHGIYFVNITSRNIVTHGRIANLGNGIMFEAVHSKSSEAKALHKRASDISIICSKLGFATQVYRVPEDASLTIDFSKVNLVPLFENSTQLEPAVVEETAEAIITHWSDRARDRHAREDQFQSYDHYLPYYWEHRTLQVDIIDYVAKGGNKIVFNMTTQWPLDRRAEEFRAFYRGLGTVAEYLYNTPSTPDATNPFKYVNTVTKFYAVDAATRQHLSRELRIGDAMEIEIGQFLAKVTDQGENLVGRDNYYGTVALYQVGKGGFVPWEAIGIFGDTTTERENSHPLPASTWMGGLTTLPYQYSNEPSFRFMQMATNLASQHGQPFVLGRRVAQTNFMNGTNAEPENPIWNEQVGKAGINYINTSCSACHQRNGHSLPPLVGMPLYTSVVKVGDTNGNPHPKMGAVLQPQSTSGGVEAFAKLSSWTETDGLRKPNFSFEGGPVPTNFSVRASPQLVGMGLLEAIPESFVQSLEDSDDANGDGISGRMNIVTDLESGLPRMGRFGWKAGKAKVSHQVAEAFNTNMGVLSSLLPKPDCGTEQMNCGNSGSEIADSNFTHLVDYISLLGVAARRDYADPVALQGEALFASAGCASCHITTAKTSPLHPKAELRNQTIHPYTDLLLHDMGPGLADNLPEALATGAEWRTAPLWSIGLADSVSGGASYLHDGRARTINEAILWHGGEGAKSSAAFKAMTANESVALIKFLKSL